MEAVSVSKHEIYLTLSMLYSKKMRRKHGGLVGKVSVHLYCTEPVFNLLLSGEDQEDV